MNKNTEERTQQLQGQDTQAQELQGIVPAEVRMHIEEMVEERWERAGIENDLIFYYVMQDSDIYLKLMQRILPELHLTRVTRLEQQKTQHGALDAKYVRYDVYSEIDGLHFVVEMQIKNLPSLRRRTRYYQSMLDIQNLRPETDYRELPDTFIIMICPFDLFGKERYLYRFRNIDIYDRNLELQDGTERIFLNSKGKVDNINSDLRNFMEMINGKQPDDPYCKEVADKVNETKHMTEVRDIFMNVNLKQMEERYYTKLEAQREARQEARQEAQREIQRKSQEAREEGLAEGRAEEQSNALRMLCNLVAKGSLAINDAVEEATSYGVSNEADLRKKAQALGIKL